MVILIIKKIILLFTRKNKHIVLYVRDKYKVSMRTDNNTTAIGEFQLTSFVYIFSLAYLTNLFKNRQNYLLNELKLKRND